MPAEDLSIDEVRSRIDAWREARPGTGRHMPKILWAAAAQLAKVHGVGPIARELELNSNRLKQRAGIKNTGRRVKMDPGANAPVRMIEVAPIQFSTADHPSCALQAQNPTAVLAAPNGVSLTLYQQLDSQGLAALIRAATEGAACSK